MGSTSPDMTRISSSPTSTGDLRRLLGTMGKREGAQLIFEDRATGGFLISGDLWTMRPAGSALPLYLCDTCGCMLQYDTGGTCLTRNCSGHPRRVDASEAFIKDRYYKQTYREDPLPIRVEEHTAQLSTKRAAAVQRDFIDGKVNVLSCTTTFELGVDVGDLRATFMRNVPPSPANYAQRAGTRPEDGRGNLGSPSRSHGSGHTTSSTTAPPRRSLRARLERHSATSRTPR